MIEKSWLSWCWQWLLGGCVAIFGALLVGVSEGVFAQIVPDNTLDAESSVVTPNVNIQGIQGDYIDGGAIRGANLFHSFQDFNAANGSITTGNLYFYSQSDSGNAGIGCRIDLTAASRHLQKFSDPFQDGVLEAVSKEK